ncbi:MAG: LPS export ABC transporter periplasmic protein LptC [Candidatus Puniceispirillales bacterium]
MKIISSKSIFASLVVIIISSFVFNSILDYNKNIKNVLTSKIPTNNKDKIFGVKIRQQSKQGEKFLIVAESLVESNSDEKKVILQNSLTTIEQNGIFTDISAGHAIISNNYDNFDFSDKVKITKKIRKFILKTESLTGTFEKGNYYTDDDVDIVSSNIKIKGTGLDVKKNGEYIKVKGKATLKMLLSNKK